MNPIVWAFTSREDWSFTYVFQDADGDPVDMSGRDYKIEIHSPSTNTVIATLKTSDATLLISGDANEKISGRLDNSVTSTFGVNKVYGADLLWTSTDEDHVVLSAKVSHVQPGNLKNGEYPGTVTVSIDPDTLESPAFVSVTLNGPQGPRGDRGANAAIATIATLGDSIAERNVYIDATSGSFKPLVSFQSHGFLTWANTLLRQRLWFPYGNNFAIGGETTVDMLARLDQIVSARPGICVVLAGTNDLTVLVDSAANITGRLQSIYERLLGAGIVVAAIPILPRSVWGSLTSDQRDTQRRVQYSVNRWIEQFCLVTPGMIFVDAAKYWTDQSSATGNPLSGLTTDGVHPDIMGAYWIGRALADALGQMIPETEALLPTSQADVYHATENPSGNLMANGQMQGSSGTATSPVTGSVATSWTALRTSSLGSSTGTVVASKETTRSDGLPGERQVLTFTNRGGGSSGIEYWGLRQFISGSGGNFEKGDIVEAVTEIEVAGADKMNCVRLRVREYDGSAFQADLRCHDVTTQTAYMPANWSGILRTPRYALEADVISGSQLQCLIEVGIDSQAGASGVVKIGRTSVRKVL